MIDTLRKHEFQIDRLTTISALAVIPVIFIEAVAEQPWLLLVAAILNWVIWCVFLVDAAAKVCVNGWGWLRSGSGVFSMVIIVASFPLLGEFLSSMRLARLARVGRAARVARTGRVGRLTRLLVLGTRGVRGLNRILDPEALPFVSLAAIIIIAVGGGALYVIEFDSASELNLADALWWSIVTVTTVGYGDLVPKTLAGRAVATVVMVIGITYTSLLTAEIAGYLSRRSQEKIEKEILGEIRILADAIERIERRLGIDVEDSAERSDDDTGSAEEP